MEGRTEKRGTLLRPRAPPEHEREHESIQEAGPSGLCHLPEAPALYSVTLGLESNTEGHTCPGSLCPCDPAEQGHSSYVSVWYSVSPLHSLTVDFVAYGSTHVVSQFPRVSCLTQRHSVLGKTALCGGEGSPCKHTFLGRMCIKLMGVGVFRACRILCQAC